MSFTARTAMDFEPASPNECAGLVLLRDTGHQIRLVVTAAGMPGGESGRPGGASGRPGGASGPKVARVIVRRGGTDEIIAEAALGAGRTYLAAEAVGQDYALRCTQDPARWRTLATVDGRVLSPAAAGDFTGAYLGMYASGDGRASANSADFDWFEYSGRDDAA